MKYPDDQPFDLQKHTILAGYVGSHSHGTYIAPKAGGIDDKDIMGFCVPPRRYYFGLDKFEQVDTWVDEYDIVIYEARKFFKLLLKANPNVFGVLWLEPNLYVKRTSFGDRLIAERDIFSSKQIYKSFTGYAYGQLKKMTCISAKGFMGSKRLELVKRHGYDTKNAAHLIRLLRMGIEFLATGELNVMRPDAQQLIAIKKGMYRLDEIKEWASDLFSEAQKALIASPLPTYPNYDRAETLLVEGITEHFQG